LAGSITAVDLSTETMDIARSRPSNAGVVFRVADAYAPSTLGRTFEAAFAGFWFSHVTIGRRAEFLGGLSSVLKPGSRVVLLDNRFVEGSSTPIADRDDEGNTFQSRPLADGTRHRVLKNFPTEVELCELAAQAGAVSAQFKQWQYFWAFEYLVAP
jgi:demethylmenaquinone methyltransferase/2-methoxy-6-polyprenyl-1,4-benzoquinol methylase